MATQQKEVVVMQRNERVHMLERLYAGFDKQLQSKVAFDNDRLTFTVKGVGEKVAQAKSATSFLGCKLNSEARAMLCQQGYDQNHVLVPGRNYQMVLYYETEFGYGGCTNANIRTLAKSEYGARVDVMPQAEFAFLVRGMFTYPEMQQLKLGYIAVPHGDIKGGVQSNQFVSHTKKGEAWMKGYLTGPDAMWERGGGFAFPLFD